MGRGASLGRTSGGPRLPGVKGENGVENDMKGKLIKTGAMALAIALFTACGSGDEPRGGTDTEIGPPQGETRAAAPAKTPEAMPTRPKRIDHLLTPTALPETTKAAEPAGKQTGGEPTSTGAAKAATGGATTIASLVPEDPRTNDRVLLQDIYAQIDLEQFALDPDRPITWQKAESRKESLKSRMPHPMVHQHPYLHLFPDLEAKVHKQSGKDIEYSPYISPEEFRMVKGRGDISAAQNGLVYFIYNPWFEPVFPSTRMQHRRFSVYDLIIARYNFDGAGPYWFGNNSTRGVLAETVAKLLEEAKLPSAEPAQAPWFRKGDKGKTDLKAPEMQEWTMEKFISNSITVKTGDWKCRGSSQRECDILEIDHITPQVQWEFLHPQLPILKITAHAEQNLPLDLAGVDIPSHYDTKTRYSVSFVMSLQNRWASFDDPNRWIIRFKEDLENYRWPPHGLDPEMPHPDYWDDTDYMQHRIIGPVVLTVHEYLGDRAIPTLKPGNYSRTPRIAHWEAPGHVLTDEQKLTTRRGGVGSFFMRGNRDDRIFRAWPELRTPNAGFPLPGHVLTGPDQGPGTETWEKYGMEGYDW